MSEILIKKEYTACISGHRNFDSEVSEEKLKQVFISLIEKGVDTFLIGMAVGFDTFCFKVLEKLKCDYNFRIISVVPCKNQADRFSISQKKEYENLLKKADEVIILSNEYTPYCMQKRNMFMVDNSRVLVAYLREEKGGTKNTVEYAKRSKKEIIRI